MNWFKRQQKKQLEAKARRLGVPADRLAKKKRADELVAPKTVKEKYDEICSYEYPAGEKLARGGRIPGFRSSEIVYPDPSIYGHSFRKSSYRIVTDTSTSAKGMSSVAWNEWMEEVAKSKPIKPKAPPPMSRSEKEKLKAHMERLMQEGRPRPETKPARTGKELDAEQEALEEALGEDVEWTEESW